MKIRLPLVKGITTFWGEDSGILLLDTNEVRIIKQYGGLHFNSRDKSQSEMCTELTLHNGERYLVKMSQEELLNRFCEYKCKLIPE